MLCLLMRSTTCVVDPRCPVKVYPRERRYGMPLLTFAMGREMGFSDRAEIAHIVASSKEKKHGLPELVHLVVQSPLF